MKRHVLALVSALALGSVAYAEPTPPAPQGQVQHRHGGPRLLRLEQKVDRAVQKGRISSAEGQKLKGEAERIRRELDTLRAQNGGKLTPEQKQQVKAEMRALREEFRSARGHPAPPPQHG